MEITENWMKEKGFKQVDNFRHYKLKVKLPYPGERWVAISLMPHDKWMGSYYVNGFAASKVFYRTNEIEALYQSVTGVSLTQIAIK